MRNPAHLFARRGKPGVPFWLIKYLPMDIYYIKSNLLVISAALPAIIGIARYKGFDRGSQIFFYLSVLSLVSESAAYYAAVHYRNSLVVYNVSTWGIGSVPISTRMICIFTPANSQNCLSPTTGAPYV